MLEGCGRKYTVIVRTASQDLRPVNIGFGTRKQKHIEDSLEYIKQVAEETCPQIYDDLCYGIEVIVDLVKQKVIYSVHKNHKKTIKVLANAIFQNAC